MVLENVGLHRNNIDLEVNIFLKEPNCTVLGEKQDD